jgi:hypothetical protein
MRVQNLNSSYAKKTTQNQKKPAFGNFLRVDINSKLPAETVAYEISHLISRSPYGQKLKADNVVSSYRNYTELLSLITQSHESPHVPHIIWTEKDKDSPIIKNAAVFVATQKPYIESLKAVYSLISSSLNGHLLTLQNESAKKCLSFDGDPPLTTIRRVATSAFHDFYDNVAEQKKLNSMHSGEKPEQITLRPGDKLEDKIRGIKILDSGIITGTDEKVYMKDGKEQVLPSFMRIIKR